MDNLTPMRKLLIPADVRGNEKIVDAQGTNLTIIVWDGPDKPGALLFEGKSDKPLWRYSFRSTTERDKKIEDTIAVAKVVMKRKQEIRQQKADYQHSLVVGDILVASWGYDQTNVDFYEVTKLKGAAIVLRPIAQEIVSSERGSGERVIPQPGDYIGQPMTKIPQLGDYVKIDRSRTARKWDGKPQYQTSAYAGH